MKRHATAKLRRWLENPYRKPLIIRGARQVGKSTLVRNFAKDNHLNLVEVNLEKHLELDDIFKTLDVQNIIREIEGLTGTNALTSNSLLFLDEIQATPLALQALRYFYEETPQLPVIAAGSLNSLSDSTCSIETMDRKRRSCISGCVKKKQATPKSIMSYRGEMLFYPLK